MDSYRVPDVPLQLPQEPLAQPGHFEALGRGLLSPTAGLTCSDSLLTDQKHLHIRGKGKLVVCNSKPAVAQNQRVSVIVLNPQRKVCVDPTFSPVKSEVNSVENGTQIPHINLDEDKTVLSVYTGSVEDWYTLKPEYAVCKPCSTDFYEPPRVREKLSPRDNDHSLEPLNTTVKSRPSDFINRSVLESVESGIHIDHPQGSGTVAAKIPQVVSTSSSFIDLKNTSNGQGQLSVQTGRHQHPQLQVVKQEVDSKLAPSHNSLQVKNVLTNTTHQGGNFGIVVKSRHVESSRQTLQPNSPLAILRSKPKLSEVGQSASSSRDLAYLHSFLPNKCRDISISPRGNLVRLLRHTKKYSKNKSTNSYIRPPIFSLGGLYYSELSKLSSHTLSGGAIKSYANFNPYFSRSGVSGNERTLDVDHFSEESKKEGWEFVTAKFRPQNFNRG